MQEKRIKQKQKACFKNKKEQLEGETFERKHNTSEKKYSMDGKKEDASIKSTPRKLLVFQKTSKWQKLRSYECWERWEHTVNTLFLILFC